MNSILNFTWRKAKVFQPSPSVAEALACCKSVFPRGAVLHYKDARRSVLAFHDQLEHVVKTARLAADDNIIRTGMLDVLGRGQMTVHQAVPALTVTKLVGLTGIQLVFVANDEHIPQGLFFPASVHSRLPQISRVSIPSAFTLEQMVEAVDRQMPDFHSEQVNLDEHDLFWCAAGHLTNGCPCAVPGHEKLECQPRGVAF